jgi:N-methylhydantoinase B
MANTRNNPLEDLAMHIPMICERYELRDDIAAGAGKMRGGIGVVKAQRMLTDGIITHESERHTSAPWGVFGGHEGAPGKCEIYNALSDAPARSMPSKFHGISVSKDDVMVYYSPCGGGYGHPLERDPAKVLDDVLDGFCTPEDAREIYGVVLDLEEETVDLAATERLRLSLEEALARMPVAIS